MRQHCMSGVADQRLDLGQGHATQLIGVDGGVVGAELGVEALTNGSVKRTERGQQIGQFLSIERHMSP
ncbi:hypothetical protein D3C86_1588050 [compost metagenome]